MNQCALRNGILRAQSHKMYEQLHDDSVAVITLTQTPLNDPKTWNPTKRSPGCRSVVLDYLWGVPFFASFRGPRFRVQGFGYRVWFRVWGLGLGIKLLDLHRAPDACLLYARHCALQSPRSTRATLGSGWRLELQGGCRMFRI